MFWKKEALVSAARHIEVRGGEGVLALFSIKKVQGTPSL